MKMCHHRRPTLIKHRQEWNLNVRSNFYHVHFVFTLTNAVVFIFMNFVMCFMSCVSHQLYWIFFFLFFSVYIDGTLHVDGVAVQRQQKRQKRRENQCDAMLKTLRSKCVYKFLIHRTTTIETNSVNSVDLFVHSTF